MKEYYVYILTNHSNSSLYIGVTNNLARRVYEHKNNFVDSFTNKYKIHKLVYFEQYQDVTLAIQREKQLKGWTRNKKDELINKSNPRWDDLYEIIL